LPDDKLGRGIILVVLAVIALGVFITIVSIRAWGPRERAEAERILWTPVPTPTVNPTVVAEQVAQDKRTARVNGIAVRIAIVALCAFVVAVGLFLAARFASSVWRAWRVAIEQPSVQILPRVRPALIGGDRVYDPAAGAVVVLDVPQPGDVEQARVVLGAEVDKLAALIAVITAKPPGERQVVERRLLEMAGPALLEDGSE
jgi:hypothetical protein